MKQGSETQSLNRMVLTLIQLVFQVKGAKNRPKFT